MAPRPPIVVKVKTSPGDIKRKTAKRTPPLPFDTAWAPPSLAGIEKLTLRGNKLTSMVGPRIIAATVDQSLDDPQTITIQIWDKQRELLQSGLLDSKIRIKLGDDSFCLTRISKAGDLLELEFEDALVNALRDFTKPVKSTRGTINRIGFVKRLVTEKGVPHMQLYIDAGSPGQVTTEKNPLALVAHKERKPGPFTKTTVKGKQANADQLDNIKVVLGHLFDQGATHKELVITSMVCTAESSWTNLKGGDADSTGLFQQQAHISTWDGGGTNRIGAATLFWNALKAAEARAPGLKNYMYAQAVQGSGAGKASSGAANYGPWEDESSKTVSAWNAAFGGSQKVVATGMYEFRRGGVDGSLEDSWECTGRLADEVQYRRFVVEGVFYFLPDDLLVGTGPRLLLTETSDGMLTPIDFDIDVGVDPQLAHFSIHSNSWYAPVGTCIELDNLGPGNGVWLVNKVSGNLLVPHEQSIELVRPRAALTEPPDDETGELPSDQNGGRAAPTGKLSDGEGLLPLTTIQSDIVLEAKTWLGVPYVYGGNSRAGVDCSGFTKLVYAKFGITTSRVSSDQYRDFPTSKDKGGLLAGDQLFFNWPPENPPGHTAIYIGAGQFIHAPHPGSQVQIADLTPYLAQGAEWYGYSRPWAPNQL